MAQSIPDLFSPADPGNGEKPTYIGGVYEREDRLAESFLEAADALAEAWLQSQQKLGRELPIALPIIQTYRHAIELGLKAQCFRVRRLLQMESVYRPGIEQPSDDKLEERLGNCHSVEQLVNILTGLSERLAVDTESSQMPDDVNANLQYLHDLDSGGTAFRYATQPVEGSRKKLWEPVRPDETGIYLGSTITRLRGAAQLIIWGMGGFLQDYEDYLQDMYGDLESVNDYGPDSYT